MSNQCRRCNKRFSSSRGLSYHEKRSRCVYEYLERTGITTNTTTTRKSVPKQPLGLPTHTPTEVLKHPGSNINITFDTVDEPGDYPVWDDCSATEDPLTTASTDTFAGNRVSARLAMKRTIEYELMPLPDDEEEEFGEQIDAVHLALAATGAQHLTVPCASDDVQQLAAPALTASGSDLAYLPNPLMNIRHGNLQLVLETEQCRDCTRPVMMQGHQSTLSTSFLT